MNILRTILTVIFLISAFAVVVIVLLQEGKSAGLGAMGGANTGGNSYWERNRKYSLEGKFEQWTKITAIVFMLSAFLIMLIPNEGALPIYPDLMDEILPAPVDGGNDEVDANGQPREDETTDGTTTDETTTDGTTTDEVTPEDTIVEENTSDLTIIAPDEVAPATPEDTTTDVTDTTATTTESETTTEATGTAETITETTTNPTATTGEETPVNDTTTE